MKKERGVMPITHKSYTQSTHTSSPSPAVPHRPPAGRLSPLWRALASGGRHRSYLQWTLIVTQSIIILLLIWGDSDCSASIRYGRQTQAADEYRDYNHDINDKMNVGGDSHASTGVKFNRMGQVDMTSLVDMLGDLPEINDDVSKSLNVPDHPKRVFYNRVPKCGSSTLLDLMIEMSKIHNFTFTRAKEYMTFFVDNDFQESFVNRVREIPTPSLYERHFHFTDFTKFGLDQPVYINLIRDPLERLVSWYYFRRFQDGHVRQMETNKRIRTFDECVLQNYSECVNPIGDSAEEGYFKLIPFFCGQEEFCREPTEVALVHAIRNVKRHYVVVGVMEQYSKFVEALEYVLPSYFKGSPKLFEILEKEWSGRHRTTYKLPVSTMVKRQMRNKLKMEYQFYLFVRQRFYNLLADIENSKSKMLAKR